MGKKKGEIQELNLGNASFSGSLFLVRKNYCEYAK